MTSYEQDEQGALALLERYETLRREYIAAIAEANRVRVQSEINRLWPSQPNSAR